MRFLVLAGLIVASVQARDALHRLWQPGDKAQSAVIAPGALTALGLLGDVISLSEAVSTPFRGIIDRAALKRAAMDNLSLGLAAGLGGNA